MIVSAGWPPSAVTEIYDIASNTWSNGNPLPATQQVGSTLRLGFDAILYIGGDKSGGHSDLIYEYNSDTEAWTTRAESLKFGIKQQSAVMIKNGLITC